jgi:dTDP-4-amino-4,6-dideoxygalactose transaminase
MDEIMDIATRHGCLVIEDAAHAVEAVYKGRNIGTVGHFTCFSFYVTKNLTTGEGGMVTTQDQEAADRIRIYSLHGLSRDAWQRYSQGPTAHYLAEVPGFKYNMTDMQAALGIHQLRKLARMSERRAEIWRRYTDGLGHLPIGLPAPIEPGTVHARHLYTLSIDEGRCGVSRDRFAARLFDRQIGSGIHFIGVHLQPYYQRVYGYRADDFPNSTWISERTLSLPFSASLSDDDVDRVVAAVKHILD